jgi:hypothetical protein
MILNIMILMLTLSSTFSVKKWTPSQQFLKYNNPGGSEIDILQNPPSIKKVNGKL